MPSPKKVLCELRRLGWGAHCCFSQTHVAKNTGCVCHLDGEMVHSLAKQLLHLILSFSSVGNTIKEIKISDRLCWSTLSSGLNPQTVHPNEKLFNHILFFHVSNSVYQLFI